jgi:hypothetical protein
VVGLCSLDPNLTSSISSGHALSHTYNSNILKVSDSFWIWSSVFVPAPAPRVLDVSSLPFPLGSTIGGGQTFNTNTKVTWPTFVKQESSHAWVCDLGAVGASLIFGLVRAVGRETKVGDDLTRASVFRVGGTSVDSGSRARPSHSCGG